MILPAFAVNSAPVIAPVSDQYILEGQSLTLHFIATDIDHNALTMGATGRPVGAAFTDSGNGAALLQWRPDYTGPNSSEGSPVNLTLWASDGLNTATLTTRIFVINSNRKPVISYPPTVTAVAGEPVSFAFSAADPDYDSLSWTIISRPANSQVTLGNQVQFDWSTALKDSGSFEVGVAAADRYGAADTALVTLDISPAEIYALSIDTASGYSGELVPISLRLSNLVPVGGFDVLINYDVSALTLSSLTRVGTRSAAFEYFTYRLDERSISGDIHVTGIADLLNGTTTPNLPAGEGPIAAMTFYTTNDLNFAGMAVQVGFAFRDLLDRSDNTLTDTAGIRIEQSAIRYADGYVAIKQVSQKGLGDINLNGLPYEIGDAIFLTNFFIDPRTYPLNSEQRANSDVNQDGLSATVADLVYLMNKIVNLTANNKLRYDGDAVSVAAGHENGEFALSYDSPIPLGGMALTLEASRMLEENISVITGAAAAGMLCKWKSDGNELRILIYSDKGQVLSAGMNRILNISAPGLKIKDIQISSADGFIAPVVLKDDPAALPKGFSLYQNYPNPFNPATAIAFDLPASCEVVLSIYDILGREVRTLAGGVFPAGHQVVAWDGKDNRGNTAASGIYFYQIKAADFTARKKMILIK